MSSSVKIIVGVVTAVIISGILLAYLLGPLMGNLGTVQPENYQPEDGIYQDSQAVKNLQDRKRPDIKVRNGIIFTCQTVNVMDFIESITDADGADLTSRVKLQGEYLEADNTFYSNTPGTYYITCSVTDSYGIKAEKIITVLVNNQKGGSSS